MIGRVRRCIGTWNGLLVASLALLSPAATPAAALDFHQALSRVCGGPGFAGREGLETSDIPGTDNDLPSIRVTDRASGSFMHVYYQPAYEAAARARAVCLGQEIGLLREALGDERRNVEWFAVVFADQDYVPPRRGEQARWLSPAEPQRDVFISQTMPHEQVHAFQARAGATAPRWFHEGQAVWVASKIIPVIRPDLGRTEARGREAALADLEGTPALAAWGGIRVKREAFRRQVSPELQARMDADPSFSPPGPFRFGPDDLESDERNTAGRYAAAGKLFADLEARHGAAAVRDWARAVTEAGGRISNEDVIASALHWFGEDIGPLLE